MEDEILDAVLGKGALDQPSIGRAAVIPLDRDL
jgi:hypothetical protein